MNAVARPQHLASTTISGTPIAALYFALQAVATICWWIGVRTSESFAQAFRFDDGKDVHARFVWADATFLIVCSMAAAVLCWRGSAARVACGWLVTGAAGYAALYTVAGAASTERGWWSVALMVPAALASGLSALDASPEAFHPFSRARSASPRRHLIETLIQTALFWAVFLWLIPSAIVFVEGRLGGPLFEGPLLDGRLLDGSAVQAMGVGLFTLCSGLGLWSGATMARHGDGTPLPNRGTNRLVECGPYAWIRNPMVVTGVGQALGVGFWLGSPAVLGYALVGALVWHVAVRPAEESDLGGHLGEEYTRYRARVRCWLPRLGARRDQRIGATRTDDER